MSHDLVGGPARWALVTVTYNSSEKLLSHWKDVELPDGFVWVVVDNNSTDGSAEVAERLGAHAIKLASNIGFGAANNVGFRASDSHYVAFVNPDVTPNLDDFDHLEKALRDDPTALVAPQLINADGSLQPNGRGEPYLWWKILHRVRPSLVAENYRMYAAESEVKSVVWLTGAVVAGARHRFEVLGPWDERFFVYYEDTDLSLRNSSAGGCSVLLGCARWTHAWARESTGFNWRGWKLEFGSLMKFYSRYPRYLYPKKPGSVTTPREQGA